MLKIISLLAMFGSALITFAQVDRMEPPFWWAEMERSKVEVMLYGEDIADYTPKSTDLTITSVRRTENPNYLFVTLDTEGKQAGTYTLNLHQKRKVIPIQYALKERRKGSKMREGFSSEDVIYLIMPDRFANGDPSNDNLKAMNERSNRANDGGRHGGDLAGVIEQLDYIEELGATAIWSTPLLEDNDTTYSYHGYAQSDCYRIDPRYGSNEDYKKLSAELHQRDMKLMMDYVTNHWGLTHWMIRDLPSYDWIHQFPGYGQTNYRMTTQTDPNKSERDFKWCVDGWFVKSMPDLNHKNDLLLRYLIQNAIWWIEFADLDGFRVDTYSYGDKDAMSAWVKAIMTEYPNFNVVGEVWMHNQAQIAYWQGDSKIGAIQSYNSHLPSVMDFTLHDAFLEVFRETESSWNKGMIKVYENLTNDFLYTDINNILIFTENHDTPRFNEIYPKLDDYKLVMTLVATMRGIPQIYYGTEIGMKGKKEVGDGDIRRDFPGGWKGDQIDAFNQETRTNEQHQYFAYTKKLLNWRKNSPVIHHGKTVQFIPEQNVYVYFRILGEESVMVIVNNSLKEVSLNLSRFAECLEGVKSGTAVMGGQMYDLEKKTLKIAGKKSLILELNEK